MLATLIVCGAASAHGSLASAQSCPMAASDIDTGLPDETCSSQTVPAPSVQVENEINFADRSDGTRHDGTNRLG
jgi:hypothetical protein